MTQSGPSADRLGPAVAVLDGVGQQVDHRPPQQGEVAPHDGLLLLGVAGIHLDADAAGLGLGPHFVGRRIDQAGQVELDEILGVGAFGPHQAEQAVGQIEGRAGVAGDPRDLLDLRPARPDSPR
jgi:hypothetical protein